MRFKEYVKALSLILTASIVLGLFSFTKEVSAAEDISLTGSANVQKYGVIDGVWDVSASTLTLSGKDPSDANAPYRQIEAITVNINNPTGITGSLKYKVYVQRFGWQDFKDAGTEAGTASKGLKIEALKMELTGDLAEQYRIEYAVVLQKYGNNQGFVSDGSLAGAIGETKLIEEIKIRIVPVATGSAPSVNYRVHRDSTGWETNWSKDGVQSGAAGKGKRIDSFAINLTGGKYKGGITYRSFVQKTGWEKNWSSNGDASGIQGTRLDEIQINLTGEVAKHYDVYYRVYAQNFGWLGWAKNGKSSGTKDLGKQLEAIQVILVLKDKTAPVEVDGVESVVDIPEINSRTPILPGGGLFKMGENALVSYAVKTKKGWSEIKSDGEVLEVTDPVTGIAVGVDVPDHYLDLFANYPYYGESVWDTKKYDANYSLRIIEDRKNLEYVAMMLMDGEYEEGGPDEEGNEDEEDDYEETSYTRAQNYVKEVQKYCQKWDVDPALAFAIMQTESSFNPKAKSYVPAYGLMQIVPRSAGADCAQSLKKPFSAPTANYLYEPENNIEMGVHYLYLLKKRYYTKVTDVRSQNLCIIASYNTGAGNVAKALRGDYNISKAIPQINEMTYEHHPA